MTITDFHFLRPIWFLALVPVVVLLWAVRRSSDAARPWRGIVADHLIPYLVQNPGKVVRQGPWWLMLSGWFLAIACLAGPSWQREPSPFADDTAALAVVIRVSDSMRTEDIAPDRLSRSVQKLHDLLARRGNSKTALIAYGGSAHLVMPPTTDAAIVDAFAAALDPAIMPMEGDAAGQALVLASATLKETGGGSIVWITDSVSPGEIAAIEKWRDRSSTPVRLFVPLAETGLLDRAASAADARIVALRPDDADVDELERTARFAPALGDSDETRWQDGGYYLVPLLAVFVLPYFRKGWMAPVAAKA